MSDTPKLTGFELIELIGEGGMGHVWKARQLSLDRLVAIKLLPPRFSHDPESVRQIIQEARIAAKLKHPGIVQVYDANEQDGTFFFVMEYVDGYNVGQWVSRKKCLNHKDALIVVESVATALNYAWRTSGLIHCDIKPENIMVDQDGSIKVADLGLSLTRDSKQLLPDDEVAGSPSYISPEQVVGVKDLDCRTDIYGLGCCLYHMVTGKRPFHELAETAVMEAQVASFIPDPRDLVPGVPGPVCALIERMLVKNRDNRIKDWQGVLTEIHRVQRGFMPSGGHPEEQASTMRRHPVVLTPAPDEKEPAAPPPSGWGQLLTALVFVAVISGFAAGFYWLIFRKPVKQDVILPPAPVVTHTVASGAVPESAPGAHELARPVKPHQADAASELAAAIQEIQRVTEGYVAEGSYTEAIRWLEGYFGRWAGATSTNRAELVAMVRRKMAEAELAKRSEEAWQTLARDLASAISTGKYAAARQAIDEAAKQDQFAEHRGDLVAMNEILSAIPALNDKLLETFSRMVGQVVTIPLGRGEFVGRLVEIRDRKLICKTVDGSAEINIRLEEITGAERQRRLASLDCAEAYLVRGVGALNEGKLEEAVALLAKTGPVLGPFLMKDIQADTEASRRAVMASDESLMAFLTLLKKIGPDPGAFDSTLWRKAIDELRLPVEVAGALDKDLDAYLLAYGKSGFAEKNADLILALQKAIGKAATPEGAVSPEPPPAPVEESVLNTLTGALLMKNPALLPAAINLEPASPAGKIKVSIASPDLIDLSPLAEFKDLVALEVEARTKPGSALLEVSSLAGLPLKSFALRGYDAADITKLKGMKLSRLVIPAVSLKSLAFLQGMPLTVLDVSGCAISDLTPLQGMKLENLQLNNTKVTSVMSLSGMPLRELGLRGSAIRDITYLQGLPLERLDLSGTGILDFSPLRCLKLTALAIAGTGVRDLSFCMEMPLAELDISGTTLSSLGPLTGKSFKRLILGDAAIRDVSAFKTIKAAYLDLSGSKLSASVLTVPMAQSHCDEINLANSGFDKIDFIRGSRNLRNLNLSNVKVYDLSPLDHLPIEVLNIKGVPATDISSLRTLSSLKVLYVDNSKDPRLLYVIKAAPGLARINGQPVRAVVDQLSSLVRPNKGEP